VQEGEQAKSPRQNSHGFSQAMTPKPRKKLRTGSLQHGLMPVGELDENIFEAESEWTNLGDGNTVLITNVRAKETASCE
jgi:hypothetical protein